MDKATRIIDENECFTEEECVEFILNDLNTNNRDAIVRHTATCQECADMLDDFTEFDTILTDAGRIKVAENRLAELSTAPIKPSKKSTKPVELFYTLTPTSVGNLLLAATNEGLCKVSFLGGVMEPEDVLKGQHKGNFDLHRDDKLLAPAVTELREYFSGQRESFDLPLDLMLVTSPFQRKVLEATRNIPFGEYASYGELAARIGHPHAYRAVGTALGKNPIPIILPCHRIIASNGKIGGYTGGLNIKRTLMDIEGIRLSLFN